MADPHEDVEPVIRAHCEAGRWQQAATLWIETRGPEVMTFLAAMGGDGAADPHELFAQFCEDLWRGLPAFRWECTTRTWSYRIARNAWRRSVKQTRRRGRVLRQPLGSGIDEIAERVRTSTAIYARTDTKDRFVALRDRLSAEDRMLLLLRVDRDLDWDDVARVMMDEGATRADPLPQVSARLRKQFQRVKRKLRELAVADGLLTDE